MLTRTKRRKGPLHGATIAADWGAYSGCGRKLPPSELIRFSQLVREPKNASFARIEGINLLSDAGSFRLNHEESVVQTVDVVLTLPISAEDWGVATALHCLSDIHAAGGEPVAALGIIESTTNEEGLDHLHAAYGAAVETLNGEGVALIGGHSLFSSVNKIGFAITALAKTRLLRNVANARTGDRLLLSKPIGGGAVMAFRAATGAAVDDDVLVSLRTSSRLTGDIASRQELTCVSDVSGFGLLGTLSQLAVESGVDIKVHVEQIPMFSAARRCIRQGVISPLAEKSWLFRKETVVGEVDLEIGFLLCDPQVNGGHIMSVPEESLRSVLRDAQGEGITLSDIGVVGEATSMPHVLLC